MRPVIVAAGWVFLMLAVASAASGIAHDAVCTFARRRMAHARVLLISLFALLAFTFAIILFQA